MRRACSLLLPLFALACGHADLVGGGKGKRSTGSADTPTQPAAPAPLVRPAGEAATPLEGTWRYVCQPGGVDNSITTWELAGPHFRVTYESFVFSQQKCSAPGAKGDTVITIAGTFALEGAATLGDGVQDVVLTLESFQVAALNDGAVKFFNDLCDRRWVTGAAYEIVGQTACAPSRKTMARGAAVKDLARVTGAGLEFGNVSVADEAQWVDPEPRPGKISDNPYVERQVYVRVP